jgi:uncharacterized membrane protein
MDLQDTFYLVGIIYMIFMLVVAVIVLIFLFILKSKVDKLQREIDKRLDVVRTASQQASAWLTTIRRIVKR